jgi:hypothetical protein
MADTKSAETAPIASHDGRRLSASQLTAVVEAAYILDAVGR